jgi:hypothetical protein
MKTQPAAQTCGAGAHRPGFGGSALGAAGRAQHWRQPTNHVAMAAALCRERVDDLLRDKTRKPGKAPIAAETTARVVALTCTEPPHQATHWTSRAMAKAIGISLGSVQRIWRGAQTAAASAAHLQALARSRLCRQAH